MKLLKGTFFLKFAALLMAIATYFYIHREIETTEKKSTTDASYRLIKLTAKNLPVKVRLETQPPDGYRIIEDRVLVSPAEVMVIGPEALLETASAAETTLVDISESKRTVVKKVPLESVAGNHLTGRPHMIEVTVPIEAVSAPAEGA